MGHSVKLYELKARRVVISMVILKNCYTCITIIMVITMVITIVIFQSLYYNYVYYSGFYNGYYNGYITMVISK